MRAEAVDLLAKTVFYFLWAALNVVWDWLFSYQSHK